MRALAAGSILFVTSAALAALDPSLVGVWQANVMGAPVSIEIRGDGGCIFAGLPATCTTLGAALAVQGENGAQSYQWSVSGNELRLSGGDLMTPLVFLRIGAQRAPPRGKRGAKQVEHSANAPPEKGSRATIDKESWGVTLTLPGGWKSVEKEGAILAGSDTEPGLIMIRYLSRMSREQMLSAYQAGINEQGLIARPVGAATDFDAKGGAALAGVLEGVAQDGNILRVRSIGVLSRFGGAMIVMGITTAAQYPALASRAEAVARSVRFRKPPKAAPIAGNYEYIYVSRVGSYSRESRITLCQSGRFSKSGEMAGSGAAGSAFTSHGDSGTWTADGDASGGTLTLMWSDGSVSTMPYRVSTDPKDRGGYGPGLFIGDVLYQMTGAGGC